MTKKEKFTKKDQYLLMLGVLLAFLIQVIYDVAREFAEIVFYGTGGTGTINWYWLFLQTCLFTIFAFFALLIYRRVEEK